MHLRWIAVVLAGRLALAPFAFADQAASETPIRAAAAREAARVAAPDPRGEMPKGLKWTGIGLMLAGGLTLFTTAIGNCGTNCGPRSIGYVVGGTEFAVGSLLIGLAETHRRPASPSLVLHDGRAVLQQRITF